MVLRTGRPPAAICSHCYGPLEDGECPFCETFDEVIGR